jgi:hypothetical protein
VGILLNGGNYVYGRFFLTKEQEQLTNKYELMPPEDIGDIFGKVMEYKLKLLVPSID